MRILHDQFGVHTEDTRYCSKLEAKIQANYPGKLHFLTVDENTPAIVISADALYEHNHLLKKAAECLREDIIEHAQSLPPCNYLTSPTLDFRSLTIRPSFKKLDQNIYCKNLC